MSTLLTIPQYTSLYLTRFANKSIPIAQQVFRDEFIQAVEQHIGVHGSVSELWSAVQSNFSTAYTDITNRRAGHLLFWSDGTGEGVGIVLPDTSKMRVLDPTATTALPTVGVAGKSFLGGVDVGGLLERNNETTYAINFSVYPFDSSFGLWDANLMNFNKTTHYFDSTEGVYKPFVVGEKHSILKQKYNYFELDGTPRYAFQILALEGKEIDLEVQILNKHNVTNSDYVWYKKSPCFEILLQGNQPVPTQVINGEEWGKIKAASLASTIQGGEEVSKKIKLKAGKILGNNHLLSFYNDRKEVIGMIELFENAKIKLPTRFVAAIREYSGDSGALSKQESDFNAIVSAVQSVSSDITSKGLIQAGIELDYEISPADNSITIHRLLFDDSDSNVFDSNTNYFISASQTLADLSLLYAQNLDNPPFDGIVILVTLANSDLGGEGLMESMSCQGCGMKSCIIFGTNNASVKTYIHEIGHILSLRHIFNGNYNSGINPDNFPNLEVLKDNLTVRENLYTSYMALPNSQRDPIEEQTRNNNFEEAKKEFATAKIESQGLPFLYNKGTTSLFMDYDNTKKQFNSHQWLTMRNEAITNHHGIKV